MDLAIRNSLLSFQNTITITTDPSDFLKMVITVQKKHFQSSFPRKSYIETIKTLIETNSRENWREKLMKTLNQFVNMTFLRIHFDLF